MRDFEKLVPAIPVQNTPSTEKEINWKKALGLGLCRSEAEIKSEKAWSVLLTDMRELCPETNWLSICEDKFEANDYKKISDVHQWLKAIVAKPEWPFPKQVILMTNNKNGRSWKVIFEKIEFRLPFVPHPSGLTMSPYKDKYSSGWKITTQTTFTVNKAGLA